MTSLSQMPNLVKPNRDLSLLCPKFRALVESALEECQDAGYHVAVFEGWRSPARQDFLYAQGRTAPGKVVTQARAWQSWHQYSCAIDVVGYHKGRWDWSIDYDKITPIFEARGLKSLSFERSHFEITGGLSWRDAKEIYLHDGLQSLWMKLFP